MTTSLQLANEETAKAITSELSFWSLGIREMKKAFGGADNESEKYKKMQITNKEALYEKDLIEKRK